MPIIEPEKGFCQFPPSCLAILLLLCLLSSGCASSISNKSLYERLDKVSVPPVVIDVRSRSEYAKGHLPGALNIPVHVLPFSLDDIPVRDKNETVVVYCAHGPRAGLAGFILKVSGYKEVLHLSGDMVGWKADGLPVEKP